MTLAYDGSGQITAEMEVNSAAITASALDTTATVNSIAIDNRDGAITFVGVGFAATDKTGTSPTLNVILQGSMDGTNFVTLKDSAGNDISTTATSISGAGGGTTIAAYTDTVVDPRVSFPAFLRIQVAVGGSSSPGWNGTAGYTIKRNSKLKR